MGWLYLASVVVLNTALWPVSRWTLEDGRNPRIMGFWLSLTACAASLLVLSARGAAFNVPGVWLAAFAFAVAYAVGFIILMLKALQIGPAGPTATINNSAMIFGVLYGLLWLDPHVPNLWVSAGIVGVFVALGLVGCGGRQATSEVACDSGKWLRLVSAGGALAGLSFAAQTYVGVRHPGVDSSLLFVCGGFGFCAGILWVSAARDPQILVRPSRERCGGIVMGLSSAVAFALTVMAFSEVGAEIVLPVSVASPMILVSLIGAFAYKERLSRATWIGCLLAVLSIGAMSYGSSLPRNVAVAKGT